MSCIRSSTGIGVGLEFHVSIYVNRERRVSLRLIVSNFSPTFSYIRI